MYVCVRLCVCPNATVHPGKRRRYSTHLPTPIHLRGKVRIVGKHFQIKNLGPLRIRSLFIFIRLLHACTPATPARLHACMLARPHERTNRPTPCDLLTCHFQSLANLNPKVAPFLFPGLFHALARRSEISRRHPIKPIPNFITALTRDPHPIILRLHTTPGPLEFHPINRRSNCYSSFP